MHKLSNRQIYWIGFIVIVVIYSLYNLYLVDVGYYQDIPRKVRHMGKFAAILTIYATGTFALRRYTAEWMMFIWHLVHIVIIGLLLLIGIYDWTFGEISAQMRNVANTLFEFLISPLIYIGVGILNTTFSRSDKSISNK
ncbi:MAG: hypothetical protein ACTHNW_06175 [Mucilaginibacter sp.]